MVAQELLFKQRKYLAMSDEGVVRAVVGAQELSHETGEEPEPSFARVQEEEKEVTASPSRAEERTQEKDQGQEQEQEQEEEEQTKLVESKWAESKRRQEAKRAAEVQRLKAVR